MSRTNAGIQNRKVADVAAVHRKLDQTPLFHCAADGSFIRSEIRGFSGDGHLFSLRSDLKTEVDTELFVNLENDSFSSFRFESRLFDAYLILADIEERKRVVAGFRGYSV